jgi:hypothetical protein
MAVLGDGRNASARRTRVLASRRLGSKGTIPVTFENDTGDEDLAIGTFVSWVFISSIPLAHTPVILWS